MAVRTDSPQIAALKIAVEKRLGHAAECRADFTFLASEIERVPHEHLAENTLRRIWGRFEGYDTGEIAPEIFASSAVIKRQKAVLDSIRTSKPSITTLPAGEQGALIEELETFAKNIYDKI